MEITWLGHSCFRLRDKQDTLITDPYSPELGYPLAKQTSDIVTISHQHPEHSFLQGINGNPKVVCGPGEYEINNMLIIGISSFHDDERGTTRGKNTVYVIEMNELSICHLGDLGHVLTGEQVEELGNVDVLLLPVGGNSTINAPVAAEVVRQLDPKIVIPMHYKTPAINRALEPVTPFLKEIGIHEINPQAKLSVTKSNLPPAMQVILLEY
ncbi:MAG: MBL fold metallo-hydrolase [Dehalococcoidia bacterium]|nr:MAG: MBL fold metallo-hydrolase [Dehalococcoidia bacterium]